MKMAAPTPSSATPSDQEQQQQKKKQMLEEVSKRVMKKSETLILCFWLLTEGRTIVWLCGFDAVVDGQTISMAIDTATIDFGNGESYRSIVSI